MLFNSLHFLIFFAIVVGVYFVLPQKVRWAWLLAAKLLVLHGLHSNLHPGPRNHDRHRFAAGILIENAHGAARKRYLALSIIANGISGLTRARTCVDTPTVVSSTRS